MKKIVTLVLALCLALACVLTAVAEDKVYNVGVLQLVQHNALDAATKGFEETLKAKLGDKVNVVVKNAQGEMALCSTIASGYVNDGVDLIMANATPALQACVSATTDVPVLGTSVTDYGAALSIEGMDPAAGTGMNASGASDGVPGQLYADLVMELVPHAKKVAVVYCNAEANSVLQADEFIAAMPEGVECQKFTFADSNDIQAVVTSAIEGIDAMYIPTDNTAAANMTIIANVTVPAGIPVLCGEENMMAAGGLATVSISYYEIGRLAAEQAYEILVNGADVATMPIAYVTNPVKKYNPDYASAIGFSIPEGYEAFTAQ